MLTVIQLNCYEEAKTKQPLMNECLCPVTVTCSLELAFYLKAKIWALRVGSC